MPKRATIRIPVEMLSTLLRLPDGIEVLHIAVEDYGLALGLVITAPDMVDTPVDYRPPYGQLLYQGNAPSSVRIVAVDYPREPVSDSTEVAAVIPSEYFDELPPILDEGPEPNEHMRAAARHLSTTGTRAPGTDVDRGSASKA